MFLVYLFLIGMSWFVQLTFSNRNLPNKFQKSQTIEFENENVEVSYYSIGQISSESAALYLPDIYQSPEFLIPIAESDTTESTKIIFDYPQKYLSGNDISHSIESRSEMVSTFLDSLKIDTVSLRGHGYGGLPAIQLLSNSEKLKMEFTNLVLLSSYGVEELQLLGNYSFNRSIYSILHGATKTAEYLVPHMGYFYQQPIQDRYTKSLLEMDQEDVREQLKRLDIPVLIVHPVNDKFIPKSVSQETHRLIPQSFYVSPSGDHKVYFFEPEKIIQQFSWFSELSKKSDYADRDSADNERLTKANEEFDPESVNQNRSTLVLLGFMVVLIATVSEDLGVISAGLLVASGLLPFWLAIIVTIVGIFIVDMGIYLLGRYVGRPVIKRAPFKWFIKERDVESAENTFKMRGVEIIFISRFLPGARLPVYLVAGILKVNITFFLTYFFLAIIIWAPLLIWLSALIGEPILGYLNTYQDYALWVFLALMFIIYLIVKLGIPLTTVKGRQRLVIKWRRFKERYF